MLISRTWLASHFENELPDAQQIAETLLLHAFEIEGINQIENDQVIDIDVLPNRAHDCLSHRGMAREYAALTRQSTKENLRYHVNQPIVHDQDDKVEVDIVNKEQCLRYLARSIKQVSVTESPDWLKDALNSIGQRSINTIVDATNYVMFDLGQPVHAFDADKVSGSIVVRNAKEGELMTTLTGEELTLETTDLVIADQEGILALAGVKGGTKAQVDKQTKNIIVEVANFNPTTTRVTARRVKILTDSSKRFENGITSELAPEAMVAVSSLITNLAGTDNTTLGALAGVYPHPEIPTTIEVTQSNISRLLGADVSTREIADIFERLGCTYHEELGSFKVTVPVERLDLVIPEDLTEEIGRVYGYHHVPSQDLSNYTFTPSINSQHYLEAAVRNFLVQQGFSDVKTYTFVKKGEVEVANPIASDKRALRTNLYQGLSESLGLNLKYADYLGIDRIQIFEIGTIYHKDGESLACAIGIENIGKKANKVYGPVDSQLEAIVKEIESKLGINVKPDYHNHVVSFDLHGDHDFKQDSYHDFFGISSYEEGSRYHQISPYPHATRDISFWIDSDHNERELRQIIQDAGAHYLKKVFLFDRFEKEGRVSYAFSLVFQSDEGTLTDIDIEADMEKIQSVLLNLNAEIR